MSTIPQVRSGQVYEVRTGERVTIGAKGSGPNLWRVNDGETNVALCVERYGWTLASDPGEAEIPRAGQVYADPEGGKVTLTEHVREDLWRTHLGTIRLTPAKAAGWRLVSDPTEATAESVAAWEAMSVRGKVDPDYQRTHVRKRVAGLLGIKPADVLIVSTRPCSLTALVTTDRDDARLTEAEREWRAGLPAHALVSIERSQMPAWQAFADAVAAVVSDPRFVTLSKRREIEALLAAEYGPFAHARRMAAMAYCEDEGRRNYTPHESFVMMLLRSLETYETKRGGQRTPSREAREFGAAMIRDDVLDTYERERSRA